MFTLAGRVTRIEDGVIVLADAFAAARVHGAAALSAGDLAVLEVRAGEHGLELLGLVEKHAPPRRGPDSAPGRTRARTSSPSVGSHAATPRTRDSKPGASTDDVDPSRLSDVERFLEDGVGLNLRDRARALAAVRAFFGARAFLEVDTPLLVPSPGLDLHLDAVQADGGFLITSPEYQMKRLLAGGVPRQFQIAHVFRAGEKGERHNPEFTMLEWYRAFAGVDQVMRDTEELVTALVAEFSGSYQLPGEHALIDVSPPFPRLSVAAAFSRFADVPEALCFRLAREDSEAFFRILVDKVEPELALAKTPVFLVDYPIEQASLARQKPSDPRVCERFELYLGGVELCNGFGELSDPVEQRRRLLEDQRARQAAGKAVYPIDERFLAALHEGMPPSAGNALGLDRILALCLGEHEIARVMPFPDGVI
jgi:lysyl-tRNA synthetase class 2